MLLLVSTSDKIQIVTGEAVTVDVHASYVDYSGSGVTPGRANTAISAATTTDVVAAPGASTQRNVKALLIRNKHASSSVAVTVQHTDGTTTAELYKATLMPGETLQFLDGVGFFTVSGSTPQQTFKALAGDQSNSTATPTEVTGLTVPAGVGTYVFQYYILYQAAATGTGVRFSVNHDGTVTAFVYSWRWVDASATASTAAAHQAAVGAAGQVMGAMSARAKSTAGTGTTISVDAANSDMLAIIEGMMIVTVAGDLELWHGSEVAAQSTVKAGSSLLLTKTD